MADNRTFSESWYRVADLRIELRPAVTIRKQMFRGKCWYVLQDPFNNHYFRLPPEAQQFVSRLTKDRTVDQIWQECLEHNPETAPGQDDVIQLLAQLHQANLLYSELPADSSSLFVRYQQRKQKESRSKFTNLMFFRIPLFDPTKLLRKNTLLVRLLTGRFTALIWLLIVVFAAKNILEHFPLVLTEAKTLLDFDNLILLYSGLVLVKILHELGHTLACNKFGGEVHTVGVMLIAFAPLPYMDATSSWAFRERRQRILVASAGMLFELFAAACAAILWAHTGPGAIHSLAFNMLVAGSISTLLFNLNPLLRYDGYYILSDLLDIPNLQPKAISQLKHLAKTWLFGCDSTTEATTRTEVFWLVSYGILSGCYRVVVYGSIILFVADRFLILGILMAVFCLVSWGLLPIGRFFSYLFTSPQLERNRPRAICVSILASVLIIVSIGLVPFPNQFRAPGVVEADNFSRIINSAPGRITEILAVNGSRVEAGTELIRMVDPELDIEISSIEAQRKEVLLLLQQSLTLFKDNTRRILETRMATLDNKLANLARQKTDLLITAPTTGIWLVPDIHELKGSWLPRGTQLGQLISLTGFSFTAVVSQEEAASLFDAQITEDIEVRLAGQANNRLQVNSHKIIPFQQEFLPSAALGWSAGGKIPVADNDTQGLKTLEPYFRIDAALQNSDTVLLNHGHSGQIRFLLKPEPLLYQWLRMTRQFFQKRYQT